MKISRFTLISSLGSCSLAYGCGDGSADGAIDPNVLPGALDDGAPDDDSAASSSGGSAGRGPCERSWTEEWEVEVVPGPPDHDGQSTIHAFATHAAGLGLVHRESGPEGDDEIWFTERVDGTWREPELVESTRRDFAQTFLGFDGLAPRIGAQQEPWILSECDVALWSRSGDTWQQEEILDYWCNMSMSFSSDGAEIVMIDLNTIEYLVKRGGEWESEVVASAESYGSIRALEARLVVDDVAGIETRRVAYRHDVGDRGEIHLATRTGGIWQDELVSTSADDTTAVQVVPSSNDGIHLGFIDLEGRATLASSIAGGAWAFSRVGGGDLDHFEMLLDEAGMGMMIWSDASEDDEEDRWYATSFYDAVRAFRGPKESSFELAVTTDHIHVVYVATGAEASPEGNICHAALPR